MIIVKKTKQWMQFESLFDDSITDRFEWFLFEFGKRLTFMVHEELLGKLSKVKGTRDYQKQLMVAEIRDKGGRAWWTIAAKAKTVGQHQDYSSDTSLLTVVPRFKVEGENPIDEILVQFGPWMVDTIPFIPSQRQASVVISKATPSKIEQIKAKNKTNMRAIASFMQKHALEFDTRQKVYRELKVVPDLEIEAIRIEFGLAENSGSHWRPAIRFAKTTAIDKLKKDEQLIRAMTDPKFRGFKNRKHIGEYMSPSEVKALESFQKQIRQGTK